MWRCIPVCFILFGLIIFYYSGFYHYLSFESLKAHHHFLSVWTQAHYLSAVIIYISLYILAVLLSVPGIFLFSLSGGFFFGIWQGALYEVISVSVGSLLLFCTVKISFSPWFKKISNPRLQKLERGFQSGAFSYILTLRLMPFFPSWVVDIAAALLGARLITFVIATFIGIIPGAIIYAALGSHLGNLFSLEQTPSLSWLLQPSFLILFFGLAVLAIVPSLYQRLRVAY